VQRAWHPLTVPAPDAVDLAAFNAEPADRATQRLRACNAAPRFAAELVAGRPYPDVDALARRADQVVRGLPWAEVALALAAHPRIGERPEGSSAEAVASRREQGSLHGADAEVRAALADGNRSYEERFGHAFLIRAADRGPQEMLAELRRRLGNDEPAERAEVTGQLAEITALRVRGMVGSP
jgi:2-oxo-4-hydroxy-4-carboxy-5-ureidoimidazoline decarboxylase